MRRRLPVAIFFLGAGLMHFVKPGAYEPTVPDALPAHREIVYVSGLAEIAGGVGVLPERTRRGSRWWLLATLAAVYPANIHMAVNSKDFEQIPAPALWARLPVQFVFAWITWRGTD